MAVQAKIEFFGEDGKACAHAWHIALPEFLDWMPIEVKIYWFTERGFGEPAASQLLFHSQGEQRLVKIETPLRKLDHKQLQENEHGLEERVQEWVDRQGIGRTPRNQ